MKAKDIKKLKTRPLADLLTELAQTKKKADAVAAEGLTDMGIELNGRPAFVRQITMHQAAQIEYSAVGQRGRIDPVKLARGKPLLIHFAVVDSTGAPIFPAEQDVNLSPELGDAVWTVCARVNRFGAFRFVDEDSGEPAPGN